MNRHALYVLIVATVFVAVTVIFVAFPRSTYSELEKRDLKTFPKVTKESIVNNTLPGDISSWFSDTEPYRDEIMGMSMALREALKLNVEGDSNITFHAPEPATPSPKNNGTTPIAEEENVQLPDEGVAKISGAGILIIGKEPTVRALMAYGGTEKYGGEYARMLNDYGRILSKEGVRVYTMVMPNATEFYLPASASKRSKPQLPTIKNVYSLLDSTVTPVNAHHALAMHRDEDIYLRTDHHWAPLGGFYAAQEFARTAGVPFKGLQDYDRKVVKGYVGSMYGYSKDISVKRSPEDFVYHVPHLDLKTTYTVMDVDKDYKVTGEGKPFSGEYFIHYKDGSGGAYCTFMGGDNRITKVVTGSNQPRKLLIIKDSYGNTLPGYLFYSFGEVHVVDFRYFPHNIVKYIKEHGVTDVLIANNVFSTCAPSVAQKLEKFLKN